MLEGRWEGERRGGSVCVCVCARKAACAQVMETYVVDVGLGVLKYGVEESYISPLETSKTRCGEHFEVRPPAPARANFSLPPPVLPHASPLSCWQGRKVRIPHLKHMISLSRRVHDRDLEGTVSLCDSTQAAIYCA